MMASAGGSTPTAPSLSTSQGKPTPMSFIPINELELAVGGLIDARDKEGKWVAAQIVKLSASERTPPDSDATVPPLACERSRVRYVRVNFVGWPSKWDEW
jgi:hypothetical protein